MKETKCEHCSDCTDGHLENCNNCGKRLNDRHLSEIEARESIEMRGLPLIKIDPDTPFIKKGFLQVLRFIQLIFFSIISMVAAMASSTVH